jgi:Protein of unknown function (DUF2878)
MRTFWSTLAAYELVWLAAVVGAGHGLVWPGVAAAGCFAGWRLTVSPWRRIELKLIAVTVPMALALEGFWVACGLIAYSAPWPSANAPAWLLALWVAFALTLVPLFGYLHGRPLLALLLGAVGGPLAYAGAARAHALQFPSPPWRSLAALSLGWAIALSSLTAVAARWLRDGRPKEAR